MVDGPWWVRKWWSFVVRKGNYTFLFMENRVAKLVKSSSGPRSCLAASLAELFIHELCRFALPHAKIQSCQHVKQCSRSRVLSFSIIIHRFWWPNFRCRSSVGWHCSNCIGHIITKSVSLNSPNMALRVSSGKAHIKLKAMLAFSPASSIDKIDKKLIKINWLISEINKIDNNFRCEKSRISILSIFIEFIDSVKYQWIRQWIPR